VNKFFFLLGAIVAQNLPLAAKDFNVLTPTAGSVAPR
jgi:hypothetical protein